LPHLSKTTWLNNTRTKIVEARKIIAENFLQTLLQSQQVRNNPDKVLNFLDLPLHFYDLCGQGTSEFEQPDIPMDIIEKISNNNK
jgi:hypothetical protein